MLELQSRFVPSQAAVVCKKVASKKSDFTFQPRFADHTSGSLGVKYNMDA